MSGFALRPDRVLTPSGFERDRAVIVEGDRIVAVVPSSEIPARQEIRLDGDLLPGFIDLQVNGGGGVLFNDEPTVEGVAAIAAAHRRFGTTGLFPTLISDDLEVVGRAVAAVEAAIAAGVPGVLGIHLEGPFLNPDKKGIHNASKFRRLDDAAIDLLTSLRGGRTLITLAPERAPPGAIRALADRGAVVAAGHTSATYEQVTDAFAEGLTGFTHLFNAMTQLNNREPGVVGAALEVRASWAGLIVDDRHVHPAALRVALAAKGADRLALVTDAMPTVGSDRDWFMLGGRRIVAEGSHCVAEDGTLAGSNLDMAQAVHNAVALMGLDLATAASMASSVPAAVMGLAGETGAIRPGPRADLALLDSDGAVRRTWIAGQASS
jgi:N-acetylglucosamine-6-phosphate deacetylase